MIKCLKRYTKHHIPLRFRVQFSPFSTISTEPRQPILSLLHLCHSCHLDFRILHGHTIASGIFHDPFTSSRLIEFCFTSNSSKYSNPQYAELIFDSIQFPDLYTWNAIIYGHINHNSPLLSLTHYVKMLRNGVSPNSYTFALVLKACLKVGCNGEAIHGQILRKGVTNFVVLKNSLLKMYCDLGCVREGRMLFNEDSCVDLISWNCMISGYVKCGEVEAGRDLFERMPERSLVSWGAMIDGYVMNGWFSEGLRLFNDMQVLGLEPDVMILVSVLKASGNLGALDKGKWVHMYVEIKKLRWERNVVLGTALVDMYAKCGCIDVAFELFSVIYDKDVVLWNAMIGGLAMHGHAHDALELFSVMRLHGTTPNGSTFVTILSACAHSGMVEVGTGVFESMKEYGIESRIEHYGCLADILGRAGKVHEAEHILLNMPMEPQASQWGALMAACRTHNNIEVGERVGKRLISLEPQDGGRYILLSNMYAAAGRWEDARRIRREMDQKGAKKETGCSVIERDGVIHEFVVGDTTHPYSMDIYQILDDLEREMKRDVYEQYILYY